MNFSEALILIKNGNRVARHGWNGNQYPKIPEYPLKDLTDRCEIHDDIVYFKLSTGKIAVCDLIDWEINLEKREEWVEGARVPFWSKTLSIDAPNIRRVQNVYMHHAIIGRPPIIMMLII